MSYPQHSAVSAVLVRFDPEGLIADGAPGDEYDWEAEMICEMARNQNLSGASIYYMWRASFGDTSTYKSADDPRLHPLYLALLEAMDDGE